jgi:hypothetical protein
MTENVIKLTNNVIKYWKFANSNSAATTPQNTKQQTQQTNKKK